MRKIVVLSLVFLASCVHSEAKKTSFGEYEQAFFEELWKVQPGWSTALGNLKYKDELKIPGVQSRNETLEFVEKELARNENLDTNEFSLAEKIDVRLIKDFLIRLKWSINEEKSFEWNPASYNIGGALASIDSTQLLDTNEKLETLQKKLEKASEFYEAAQVSIRNPTLEHTRLALQQHSGLSSYWKTRYGKLLDDSSFSQVQKDAFKLALNSASNAVDGYISFLKTLEEKLKKNGAKSFRMDDELYRRKFEMSLQSELGADAIYEKALAAKKATHEKMVEIANSLYPKYFPGQNQKISDRQKIAKLIEKLSENHPSAEEFIETIRKQIPELETFVKEKDLVYLDPSKPLVVRETPLYARGVAGASVDAPGIFDSDRETYYNVTPVDTSDEKLANSYLREYNNYTLQILNIHEAIPGHYTQLVYSNKSKSLTKSVLSSSTMVEGWAVYSEQMMLEAGYGDFSPELWLMYYKWHLRVILNTILDYEVHLKNLSESDAIKMLVEEGYQELAEAQKKWKRATLSQVQLASYYTGFAEIYELREKMKKREDFDLKAFNEKFLSYGSVPVKYIKELILERT